MRLEVETDQELPFTIGGNGNKSGAAESRMAGNAEVRSGCTTYDAVKGI